VTITDGSGSGTNAAQPESLQQLRLIADSLPVLIAQLDADGRYRFVNRPYAARFGREPAEVVGQSLEAIVGLPAYAAVLPYVIRTLAGERVTFEIEIPYDGMGPRVMRCEYVPSRSASGLVDSFTATMMDVTEQRRVERALRDRETHFRSAFELSAVGQSMIDADRRYMLVNDRFCRMTGYPREELIGRRPDDFTHPEDIARDVALATAMLRGDVEGITSEKRYIRKSGDVRWVRVHATLLKDSSGLALGAFSMIEDVTDQKLAAEQRDALYARERAARLDAEAANRTKDEFLATLSHELRTPLNAILGWTQILRRRVLDPTRVDSALAALDRNARKQAQLVDDLLDVSRIAAGRLKLNIERTSLIGVIEQAVETVRPAIDATRLPLVPPAGTAPVMVDADPRRLQQVFWNLLSNAVKFTPEGGRITLEAAPDRDQVRVVVRDTGIGIDPQFLPRLFAPFEQADQSTTRVYDGLGLGLAIVRHLVELHGGSVHAESAGSGLGACFSVTLPVRRPAATGTGPSLDERALQPPHGHDERH
jgi:PAS domain S-box-containing protein